MPLHTAEEALAINIEHMGKELGSVYTALWNDVASLYVEWEVYDALFADRSSRIDLLNRAAPFFFGSLQRWLWETVTLHVARLSDPPRTYGKDNLSMKILPELIDHDECANEADNLLEKLDEKVEFCRDWRNRWLAHRDFPLVMDRKAEPLRTATISSMRDALSANANVLNCVSGHYLNSQTAFDYSGGKDDAVSLLYVLDDGLRAREREMKQLEAGELDLSDVIERREL